MSSLTVNERTIVKNTWNRVNSNVEEAGWDIFRIFFKHHPDYQNSFKGFKDVPIDDLRANKKLQAHAASVVYQLNMLVDNLDDTEIFNEMLKRLAINHKRHGISLKMFENLELTLIEFLKERLGTNLMNEEAVNAWTKAYRILVDTVKPGLQ